MAKKPADVWGLPIPSPKDVVDFMNNAVNLGRTASGDKAALTPGDKGVRTMGQGVSLANDYLNPYANTTKQLLGMAAGNPGAEAKFAKSLAKDIAITAAGAGDGYAAKKTVKAVQESGLPARIGNMVKNEQVFVHGSPVQGIKTLMPHSPTTAYQEIPSIYGMRITPKSLINSKRPEGTLSAVLDTTSSYAQGVNKYGMEPSGSLYVTKFNRDQLMQKPFGSSSIQSTFGYKDIDTIAINSSKVPAKVYSEISRSGKTPQQIESELVKAIKKAGGKIEPSLLDRLIMNNKQAKKLQNKKVLDKFASEF